jgi:precorrin-6Y C5,15-methyltransferase (decarboxylating)
VLEAAWGALRPGGRMVVHVATVETLSVTYAGLRRLAGQVEALLVHVARGVEQLEALRFESLNPTFLLTVGKNDPGRR